MGGCCNRRLSGLVGDVAKIHFQTQSHSNPEDLRSKQQPTIDKSAEAQQAERVPLSNFTSDPNRSLVKFGKRDSSGEAVAGIPLKFKHFLSPQPAI